MNTTIAIRSASTPNPIARDLRAAVRSEWIKLRSVRSTPFFVGLIVFGGRTASTHEALQSAAAEGARTASLARDAQTARTHAREAAVASIANQDIGCSDVDVTVGTTDFNKQPGVPGSVDVTVASLESGGAGKLTNHVNVPALIRFHVRDPGLGDSAKGFFTGQLRGGVRPLLDWTTEFAESRAYETA